MLTLFGVLIIAGTLYFTLSLWKHHQEQGYLILYGNVDIRQADLGFRVSGRLAEMRFEEGDEVKKGDILAVLDKTPYEAALALAQGQLSQLKANYTKLKQGNRPQEIASAQQTLREREAASKNATALYERIQAQIKVGASSKQEFDDALAKKIEADALLQSAKQNLNLIEEGFRQEDIDAGLAAMETAEAQLEIAQITLNDTEILAPSDGIIFTRVREPGAIVNPQSIVYTLSLHKPVWVRAYVSEPNLGRIKPGMKAEIITDTHPGTPLKGQIGFISPQAEFTPKTVETPELRTDLVYRLRIYVEDSEGQLRQGMPVTVKIQNPMNKS